MHTEALPATSGELLATLTSRRAAEFRGWHCSLATESPKSSISFVPVA